MSRPASGIPRDSNSRRLPTMSRPPKHQRFRAEAWKRLKCRGGGNIGTLTAGVRHNRPANRVLGPGLDRGREPQHVAGARGPDGQHSDARSVCRSSAFPSCRTRSCPRRRGARDDAPPLTRTPLRAAADSADTIETGVDITRAQGHEITSSVSAR